MHSARSGPNWGAQTGGGGLDVAVSHLYPTSTSLCLPPTSIYGSRTLSRCHKMAANRVHSTQSVAILKAWLQEVAVFPGAARLPGPAGVNKVAMGVESMAGRNRGQGGYGGW